MNDDLKKVGLIFKSDGTTDFIKSLRLINAELNQNYSQFKLVQTQWDNSTKTSQKLKDKLDYLNNAYDIQKDKVNLLTRELSEIESAEERNELAIQKKKTQLTQAETKLASYSKQIKETSVELKTSANHLITYGEAIEKAGKKMEEAGKKTRKFSLASGTALTASLKTAIDFEDAFAGVRKTVDATDKEFEELRKGILKMSTEMPASATEISAVAEAAGQLGIQKENILSFSKTMIDLGESTNLSATDAADALARFANITNMSQKDFDKLGSVIVDLGNNCATTESEIVSMGLRLAGAGHTVGMTESEIMSFAAALSSVGIEAEAGGSAFSKMMINIESAVSTNSKDLEKYAKIVGMTADEFKEAWEKDAAGAMIKFIEGLGNVEKNGGSLIDTLDDLGISEVRLRDTMLRASNASELFAKTVKNGNKAWDENNALSKEAEKRYATLKSKMEIAMNKIKEIAINLGTKLMPSVEKIIDGFGKWTEKFNKLNDKHVDLILKIGLTIAAISPLLTILGKITGTVGGAISAIGTFSQALKVSQGAITSTNSSVNGLAQVFGAIKSPVGLAVISIGAMVSAFQLLKSHSDNSSKKVQENFESIGKSATEFLDGIQSAQSHLGAFNSTLFATSEEQQKLSQNMEEIQNGITEIARKASEERRDYTQDEIDQLDKYFQKLHETKQRELEIQQSISKAIVQQAQTASDSFNGSLSDYKILSQEWIKTAQEQYQAQINLINEQTTQEIVLLNARFGEKATIENEEYKREYEANQARKSQVVQIATDEMNSVNLIYSNGYIERANQTDSFIKRINDYNSQIEAAEQEHANILESIENGDLHGHMSRQAALIEENKRYQKDTKKIWSELYKDMDESQQEQFGVWMAMVSQTVSAGGELDAETKKTVETVIKSLNLMPEKTRKVAEQAMAPMLDEMEKAQPKLFSKAKGIADGIVNQMKKSLDIHSPSRKTRAIFKNVMKGSELGLEDEEKNLYKQTKNIAENVQSNLENIDPNIDISDMNYNQAKRFNANNQNLYNIEIDYDKLAKAFLKALTSCKLSIDQEGFVKFVQNIIYEVI